MPEKIVNTKSERNHCVSLIKREKKNFFSNIKTSDITDNKTFWKKVKPFLLIK